jgi:hypothetical protein
MDSTELIYKELTESDYDQLRELVKIAPGVLRDKEFQPDASISERSGHMGAFTRDNVLVSSLSYFRFPSLPYYLVGQYVQKPGFMIRFSWKNNPAIKMMDMILDKMEAEERFTWYYTRSIMRWPAHMRKKGNDFFSNSPRCQRYNRFLEEIIPAGQPTKFELHKKMIPSNVWKYDVIVVKCCLKNDFRPWKYVFEEEDDENN